MDEVNRPAIDVVANSIDQEASRSNRERVLIGSGMVLGGLALTAAIASGDASHLEITKSMPFIAEAQQAVDSVDKILAKFGEVAFPTVLASVGISKLLASRSSKFEYADSISSREMVSDHSKSSEFFGRKVLRKLFAGKIAVLASIGVALGSFSASIGNEVSNGPQRPIEKALSQIVPGNELIVQDQSAQPMLDGGISVGLVDRIEALDSKLYHRSADIITKNLGNITSGKASYSTLEFGTSVPVNSKLFWSPEEGCKDIPIAVDNAARFPIGSKVSLDGVPSVIVQETSGFSAIGRIGVEVSSNVMQDCLQKNPEGPVYAVVLNNSSVSQDQNLLKQANINNEAATVISKGRYLNNSLKFWEANVKPITNTMALFSALFAFSAMSGAMTSRLIRNRRELAAMSASGMKDSLIRGSELLRAAKDSVVATFTGWGIAMTTPFIVNSLETGFKASIGLKELSVGSAIGIIGCIGGVLKSLINPKKIINVKDNTRVS